MYLMQRIPLRSMMARTTAIQTLNKPTSLSSSTSSSTLRLFSAQSDSAMAGLRHVLEEYRASHYSYEIPTRFNKDLVRAAVRESTNGGVQLEGLEKVLSNIGVDERVHKQDLQILFQEEGDSNGHISADRLLRIL